MSDNPYPDIRDQPLLGNNRAPPPPPPRAANNPSFNAPNPSFNNPNPSFNNPNPVFVNNPNPSFNNPNPAFGNNPNPNNPPYINNNPNPNPYQNNPNPNYPPNQAGSVGNYQVIRNNGPYVQNFSVNVNCMMCRRETSSITRKTPGGVTWIWCFVLFVVTGFCCCIPFCVDSCQDTEIVCVNCQTVKSRIQANCC